ncbi:MAG: hypothetical protein H0T59_07495 [Chloroflexi bacterium]|nr:hypothetical protein [Chloroflexota bacterium]
MNQSDPLTDLRTDLVALLHAARAAERDLFGIPSPEVRDEAVRGTWSAKDTQAHLAAWRAIEARRLEAAGGSRDAVEPDDPTTVDPVDHSNEAIHDSRAGWSWDEVERDADASLVALIVAIEGSSAEALASVDGTSAGLGANAAIHAVGHLADVADAIGGQASFDAFAVEMEAIAGRGNLSSVDAGGLYYDLACCRALAGGLNDARRLLGAAFTLWPNLRAVAADDSDLAALDGDLEPSR